MEKAKSRRYPLQYITDADCSDDITLLANTSAQDESRLHSLEFAAGDIGPHVNTDRMVYMCINQRGVFSTVNGCSQKLVDEFIRNRSSVSSTENANNTRIVKSWTLIDRLLVIWKIDQSDKIKSPFFKRQSCQYCYMDAPHGH